MSIYKCINGWLFLYTDDGLLEEIWQGWEGAQEESWKGGNGTEKIGWWIGWGLYQ